MKKDYNTPVLEISKFESENTMLTYASNIATNVNGKVTSLADTLNVVDF